MPTPYLRIRKIFDLLLTWFCSAVLAAGCPELAPFMADECLLSMGDTEGIDYTMKEYMKLVAKTQACVDRLNEQGENIFWSFVI